MNNPTMLYRSPGPESFESVSCETTIVDEHEVEEHLTAGWSHNWIEAGEAAKARAAAEIEANEAEQARIAEQLKAAGARDGTDTATAALTAVHKGRGKWDVVAADGAVVESGLTGEEAKARVG